jgi:hypothetical protein
MTTPGTPYPVVRRHNYNIEFGPYALEIDPVGGRIIAFSLDGRSVVVPQSESPQAFGSSFWPSPQRDWNWPPPEELDALPWQADVRDQVLELQSGTNQKLGLRATQRLWADLEHEAVVIEFTLNNQGSTPRAVAPWQNTRVRPKGLTFFPSNSAMTAESRPDLAPSNGVVWFQHDPVLMKANKKLFGDGEEGWLAQVDGDLLFLKVFPPVSAAQQAPTEAEIEIYVDGGGLFVEMEQQGPYQELAPGAESVWTVHWLVRRIPKDVVIAKDSATLLAFARTLAASVQP